MRRVFSIHTHGSHCWREARGVIFLPEAVFHNNESLDALSHRRYCVQITKLLLVRYCSSRHEYVRKEMKQLSSSHTLHCLLPFKSKEHIYTPGFSRGKYENHLIIVIIDNKAKLLNNNTRFIALHNN